MVFMISLIFGFISYFVWIAAISISGLFTEKSILLSLVPMAISIAGIIHYTRLSTSKVEALENGFDFLTISFLATAVAGFLSFFTKYPLFKADGKIMSTVFIVIIVPIALAIVCNYISKKFSS